MTTATPLGLYLHIPFCRQRCDFCAFYLEIYRDNRASSFIDALRKEIRLYGRQDSVRRHRLQSIYFGGGTPTTLSPEQLAAILQDIRQAWTVADDAEVSIEAHPATVSGPDLAQLAQAGFNRLSFGAESMNDGEFAFIGRPGTADQTTQAMALAREAGFANINLDLMFGLPSQTLDGWIQTLQRIVDLNPSHISCYALTIEDNTKLAKNIEHGSIPAPDEQLQVVMDEAAHVELERAGYQHYEISNYAKPGCACRHNLLYWTNGAYLGLGPSAQSYVDGQRFGNVADLADYNRALSKQRLPIVDRTCLSLPEQLRDAVIFGLRLVDGIPTPDLEAHALRYGHRETLTGLRMQKFIEDAGCRSRLTQKGRRYADTVADKLF